jgi:hypothetical protein
MVTARRPSPRPPRAAILLSTRPWPALPVATQAQVARLLAELLRRLMPGGNPAMERRRAERRERR